MKLIVTIKDVDYCGNYVKEKVVCYESLMEGWKAYKKSLANDYWNEDGDMRITTRKVSCEYPAELPHQRPHARTSWDWQAIKTAPAGVTHEEAIKVFKGNDDVVYPF